MNLLQTLKSFNVDEKSMINDLVEICEINSHAYNTQGINKVADFLIKKYKKSFKDKITVETIKLDPHQIINDKAQIESHELGDMVFIKKEAPNPKYKIVLMGHLDTVFPIDSEFQKCTHLDNQMISLLHKPQEQGLREPERASRNLLAINEGERNEAIEACAPGLINGPGVADLKGGLLVMHKALEILESSSFADQISWTVVFNPDEEIGSPQSQKHFKKLAEDHDIGMIFEPSLSDGSIAWRRKGTGNFQLTAKGKAAHVGREFSQGQSAIYALSEFMQEANKLNSKEENIIINFGKISGGGALNTVPDTAVLGINIRTEELEDGDLALNHLNTIIKKLNQKENLELTLHGKINRKPKIPDERMDKLYEAFQACALELGQDLKKRNTGGCCDGNNFYEYGLINIDTLGVRGGKIHSSEEFICLDSLKERSQLNALFLLKLATGEVKL